MTMAAELALRFILAEGRVSTVIPGMRSIAHASFNMSVSNGKALSPELVARLRAHRWDRLATEGSL
jgi:aryl-alcohol dehydrogenase-like predicted oxidoreductase